MQLPAFENVHMLSMSRQSINAATFSPRGDWIALGCASLGQLLVWEWRSESYVLKQQGHFYDVSAVAFSPDGSYIATGAEDNKVQDGFFVLGGPHCEHQLHEYIAHG